MEIQNKYLTNNLEQIASDLVSGTKRDVSGLSATSLLEQEIELTLEQLRKLREQELDKTQFDSFPQPECCVSTEFMQADQYTPQDTYHSAYSYDRQPNHNKLQQRPYVMEAEQKREPIVIHEDRVQELQQKLLSLLEKHKQSSTRKIGDYWTGRMAETLSNSAMK
jgi:uncharacterized protein YejL (UPF0352 family)